MYFRLNSSLPSRILDSFTLLVRDALDVCMCNILHGCSHNFYTFLQRRSPGRSFPITTITDSVGYSLSLE
jgi:hypothetical protein